MPQRTVLHIISGDLWGGREAQLLLQLVALRELGCPVGVLLFSKGEAWRRYRSVGLECEVVPEAVGTLAWLSAGTKRMVELAPSLFVSHGYKEAVLGWFAGKRALTPHVTWFHGSTEIHHGVKHVRLSIYRAIHRAIARYAADGVVFVSNALRHELGFAKHGRAHVIRNVVETPLSPRRPDTIMGGLHRPAGVIVGRLVGVKRVDFAMRAVLEANRQLAAPLHLYIVGDGPLRGELESLAVALRATDRVHFLGFRQDAQELIAQADLFILSSISEGIPTVLLEAIAAGTPIVSSALPGVEEVLNLVPDFPAQIDRSHSVPGLAKAILRALETVVKRCPNEQDCVKWRNMLSGEFSPKKAAKRHLELYSAVIKG